MDEIEYETLRWDAVRDALCSGAGRAGAGAGREADCAAGGECRACGQPRRPVALALPEERGGRQFVNHRRDRARGHQPPCAGERKARLDKGAGGGRRAHPEVHPRSRDAAEAEAERGARRQERSRAAEPAAAGVSVERGERDAGEHDAQLQARPELPSAGHGGARDGRDERDADRRTGHSTAFAP